MDGGAALPRTRRPLLALWLGAAIASSAAGAAAGVDAAAADATGADATRAGAAGDEPTGPWSFRNHVQPVLTAAGCNSGPCHGAAAGKNGFKLSLRGYDAEGDHTMITRQARGRRLSLATPERSLLLLKPTGAVPHKGGVRFDRDSLEYRILAEWIAAGAPGPAANDPRIDGIEVEPRQSTLARGDRARLRVTARYSDGSRMEVTRWCKLISTVGSVAQVDAEGQVEVVGHGESAITAWYASKIAVATVASPFPGKVPPEVFAAAPRRNFIDELVLRKLEALRLPPSPRAPDAALLRRAHLDTLGVLPTVEETRAFLADGSAAKRDRLIDGLLRRPELVDYWSYKWSDLFLLSSEALRPQALWSFYHWIRSRIAAETPWDQLARELVTATGSTLENGAANFYALHQDPLDMAETTTVAFLGMSINCARCHNHPMEKWTNDQYYGMASLFARVRAKDVPGDGHKVVFAAPEGEVVQPVRGRPQPPQPLDGEALSPGDASDRRAHLARWLTSPDNPYFTRAIVNRVWANFFGRGLVDKVDDMRATNPASNEELLSALCGYLVEKRYDLKSLMRLILESETYQRSSAVTGGNAADDRFHARFLPRRLPAEVLLDSMSQVTGVPTALAGYPAGWRALQLPDSNVASYFLKSFGRPDRLTTCECERTSEPSMTQVLHLANGETLQKKLEASDNAIQKAIAAGTPPERIVEDAYLAALCRPPTAAELQAIAAEVAAAPTLREGLEDFYWSLLSSKELLFNH